MISDTLLKADSFSIALFAGAAMFLAILSVIRAIAPADNVSARARSHARRRDELRSARLETRTRRRQRPIGLARQLVEALKLHRSRDADEASGLLVQAGWRSPDATTIFLAARLSSPVLLAIGLYLAAPALVAELEFTTRLMAGFGGMIAGAYMPKLLMKNMIQRRQQAIRRGLPDALDLLVICAEAGLSLDAAIKRVASEVGPSAPDVADELGLTAVELGFLPDRREALANLTRRVAMAEIESLVSTLAQTEKYGTPLAQALRVLAQDFRNERMMKAEAKAARLPAILTVPMIIFILPPLFIVLIGPAIVQVLTTSFG